MVTGSRLTVLAMNTGAKQTRWQPQRLFDKIWGDRHARMKRAPGDILSPQQGSHDKKMARTGQTQTI
jgi:hypothetical protein